jgi:hypothetical protein
MRRLVLNATILTAVKYIQLKVRISQQAADGGILRTKGTGIEPHSKASELFKVSELKNDR